MNKKNKNEKNIIFEDFESKVEVKSSPEIDSPHKYDKSNGILAELLSWLKSFNDSIFKIRDKLEIKKPFKYPPKATVNKIVGIFFRLDNDRREILDKQAEEVVKKYKLTEDWLYPIKIAILTHTLLVPPKESIMIHLPDYFYPQETKRKPQTLLELAKNVAKMRLPPEVTKYPAIYFKRKATVDELKKWIDNNKRIIRAIQYKLPQKKIIKRERRTLFWGQVAWIFKQDGIDSWAKMRDLIDEMDKKSPLTQDDSKILDTLPTEIELEKCYKRFIKSLQTIDSS